MPSPLEIRTGDVRVFDGVAAVTIGDTIVILWEAAVTIERAERLFDWIDQSVRGAPEGLIMCQLILASSTPPDARARAMLNVRLARLGTKLRRAVVVPLGNAIWQSVVRAIVRTLVMLTRQSAILKIAANESEAFELVAQAAGIRTPKGPEFAASVAALHRALDVPRASG